MLKVLVAAVLLACGAIAAAGSVTDGYARSGAEILEDSAITTKVKSALAEAGAEFIDVEVRTHRGAVQLSGCVGSQERIDQAGGIAAVVEGVRQVTNDLVRGPE